MLRAEFRLPSITAEEAAPERKAPIRVKFEIPYFTVSGIQVCVYMEHYCMLYIFFIRNKTRVLLKDALRAFVNGPF